MIGKNDWPKGTDPEDIIDWRGGGLCADQIKEITKKAAVENIMRAIFLSSPTKERRQMVVFLDSGMGMICPGGSDRDSSDLGTWDEDGEFLQVQYDTEIINFHLDGLEEIVESLEEPDLEEE